MLDSIHHGSVVELWALTQAFDFHCLIWSVLQPHIVESTTIPSQFRTFPCIVLGGTMQGNVLNWLGIVVDSAICGCKTGCSLPWIRVALGGPERVQSTAGSLYPACSRPKPCGNYISEEKSQWHHRGSRAALSGGNNAQKVSLAKETLPCSCAKASLAGTACRAAGKHGWEVEALTCKTSRSRG